MSKPMLKRPGAWLMLLLVVIIPIGYFWLGGFKKLQVEVVTVDNYHLIGRYFTGRYKSDTIENYFSEMRSYLESGRFQGQPVIIYQQEPEGGQGKIRSFIGIRLTSKPQHDQQELSAWEINADRAIRVSKDAHIAVMPNPHNIEKIIQEHSMLENLRLGEFNIELYLPNNRLVIERPIIQ